MKVVFALEQLPHTASRQKEGRFNFREGFGFRLR